MVFGAEPGVAEVARRLEAAVPAERPPVVAADEVPSGAATGPHEDAGPVRAHVVEPAQRAGRVDGDEDREPGDIGGHIVTRASELGGGTEQQPFLRPDAATFELERGRVAV